MKYATATLLLLLICVSHGEAQQPAPKGMSAIDIAEALASPTQAVRERGELELTLMDAETGAALGGEITRLGVREAEICLRAVSRADSDHAALAACTALDSKDFEVRIGALDALIKLHPKHVGAHCDKHLRARREILRKLITEEGYLQRLAEGVQTGEDGKLVKPVAEAMRLMILYDRHFGVDAMSLIVGGFAGYLVGLPDDADVKPVKRYLNEKLRTGAVLWLEAIWVADPAIYFNYSPTAPYAERQKAAKRMSAKLKEMEQSEFSQVNDSGTTLTGIRYGDYLTGLYGSDLTDHEVAAYLRMQWWRGDEVTISGEGYAESVDTIIAMSDREKRRMRAPLYKFWYEYRKSTQLN